MGHITNECLMNPDSIVYRVTHSGTPDGHRGRAGLSYLTSLESTP